RRPDDEVSLSCAPMAEPDIQILISILTPASINCLNSVLKFGECIAKQSDRLIRWLTKRSNKLFAQLDAEACKNFFDKPFCMRMRGSRACMQPPNSILPAFLG